MCYTMRRTVTISLPAELCEVLDETSRERGMSRSEVVREALRRQFDLQEFRRIRRSLLVETEARGIVTDEDVFQRVS